VAVIESSSTLYMPRYGIKEQIINKLINLLFIVLALIKNGQLVKKSQVIEQRISATRPTTCALIQTGTIRQFYLILEY
jgi:hypothetical protein